MACKDCFLNCPDIISDKCVMYTGPDIPLLGICTGQQLDAWEADIAAALLTALDGTGIVPSTVTLVNCPTLLALLGNNTPNLNNLLQVLINNNCTLNTLVASIQSQINSQAGVVWDLGCLVGLPNSPTINDIVQQVIFQLCSLSTTVNAFPNTYVQNSDLTSLVTPIVNNIISASQVTGVPQQNAKMVPFIAYEYYGPISNFDAGGAGLVPLGFQKVYICNGNNGTPDKRGRVAVGAVRGVPGGTLDSAVDPAVNPNNPNWNLNDKAGENFHVLTQNEIPAHNHVVNDPGHTHNLVFVNANFAQTGGHTLMPTLGNDPVAATSLNGVVTKSTTGVNLGSTGGGQGHITYQPSIAANYIMYIP